MRDAEAILRRASRKRTVLYKFDLSRDQRESLKEKCADVGLEYVEIGCRYAQCNILFNLPGGENIIAGYYSEYGNGGYLEIYDLDVLTGFLKVRLWLKIHRLVSGYGKSIPQQIPSDKPDNSKD
jgi:hypothetical protein